MTSMYHPAILPVVGSDPLDLRSDKLMTACQLYKSESGQEIILQLRSGLVQGAKDQFVQDLIDWIKEVKFSKVVLLSSSASDERLDSQIQGVPFRYLTNKFETELRDLGFTELEKRQAEEIFIPGGGYTKALYEKCVEDNIPIVVLLAFASEGDNALDGVGLATYYNQWAKLISGKLKTPPSWELLFGTPAPTQIYN